MTEISYTNKDGLTPSTGTTNLDWTNRNGVSANAFNYHKDAASGAHGYAHGGYPEITGGTSPYTDTSYKTGDAVDHFGNGNTFDLTSPLVAESIAITKAPTKTTYVEGEALDLTGLEVTATMSGDGEKEVLAASQYTAEPASGAALATTDTAVVITYKENASLAASQAITVTASSASNASSAEGQG